MFPDYKDFLNKIKEKNLKITLNLHPKDGVRYYEDMYQEMCDAMGQDASEERPVEFDLTNDKFINNYFKILHKPYEHDGVAFWWIDWQQGTKSQMAGLDPLWALNHYHYLDNGLESTDPLVLSRYCEAGSHRYPLGFSADTSISYPTLDYLPYFTSTASNIGYTWWSHDIGGHHFGYTDNELFLRSVQYGIFNPIMRLHSTAMISVTKEPWAYSNGTGGLIADALRYRHSFIPFLYSEGYKTHKFGKPLIEPLYWYYPTEEKTYLKKYRNEYFFGDLLIAPITTESKYRGISSVDAFLPEGKWTDIFTGEEYDIGKGGKELTFYRSLDSIPALAKAGATVVYSGEKHTNDCSNPKNIIFEIYSGNGKYDLYEDLGTSEAFTHIENASDGETLTTKIYFDGATAILPEKRNIKIRLKNVYGGEPSVTADGEKVKVTVKCDDYVEFVIPEIDYAKTYVITAKETPLSALEYAQKQITKKIQSFEFPNWYKEDIYRVFMNKYWSKEKNCLTDMEEPVFDGTRESLINIAENFFIKDDYIGMRKALKDRVPKEMKFDKMYIMRLAESLKD